MKLLNTFLDAGSYWFGTIMKNLVKLSHWGFTLTFKNTENLDAAWALLTHLIFQLWNVWLAPYWIQCQDHMLFINQWRPTWCAVKCTLLLPRSGNLLQGNTKSFIVSSSESWTPGLLCFPLSMAGWNQWPHKRRHWWKERDVKVTE